MNARLLGCYSRGWKVGPEDGAFVLFGLMRSGTTLLGDLLMQNTDLTWLGEAFDQRIYYPILYLRDVVSQASTDFVGLKIFPFQLSKRTEPPTDGYDINDIDRGRRLIDKLHAMNWKFIHLRREDVFAQTVSFVRANQTGIWHRTTSEGPRDNERIRLNVREFERYLKILMMYREYEDRVLFCVEMLRLAYESDLQYWEDHQATADRTFRLLGLQAVSVSSRLVKLYLDPLESQIENFEEIERVARRLGVKPMSTVT